MIRAGGYADASEFAIHDWTPVLGTGITDMGIGTTSTGWYTNRSGLVTAHFYFRFDGSPVFASTIALDLPVAADVEGIQACIGSWIFRDQGSGKHYTGSMGIWSGGADDVSFSGCYDSGTGISNSRVTHTKPFTVAAGDILSGDLGYRAA